MSALRTARWRAEEERKDRELRARFDRHVATPTMFTSPDGREIGEIVWKRPDSGYYAVRYVLTSSGRVLTVTGDCYEAIYLASSPANFAFWAGCHPEYFASKCVASPQGRGFRSWDSDAARLNVRDLLAQSDDTRRHAFRRLRGWEAIEGGEHEWRQWLEEYGSDVWGGDWWERGEAGRVVDPCCEMHLVGLKMAMAQLAASATSPAGVAP